MLISSNSKILLYNKPIDFRKSYDSLIMLIEHVLHENSTSGTYFIFLNSARNRIKIIYWDDDGFAIWMKRLEYGKYKFPSSQHDIYNDKITLDLAIYNALINRVKIMSKYPRFKLKKS